MKYSHHYLSLVPIAVATATLLACSSSASNNASDQLDAATDTDSSIPQDTVDAASQDSSPAYSDTGSESAVDSDAESADSDSSSLDSSSDSSVDVAGDATTAPDDCDKLSQLDNELSQSSNPDKTSIISQFIADVSLSNGFPIRCGGQVTFLLSAPSNYTAPYVAGDFNGFSETAAKMTNIAGAYYRATLDIPSGPNRYLYKFTSSGQWMADPLARRYGFDSNGEYSLVSGGKTRGHLERHVAIGGAGLSPRPLTIYIPPGYEAANDSYPVLYAHDGQNLFDPNAAYGGWKLDATAEDLINQKKINPLVVVGIHNTSERMNEYTHVPDVVSGQTVGGKADAYYNLLSTKIMPDIQKRYRIKTGPENTYTMGSSLGGLVSLYFGMKHPDVFGRVAGLSSTAGWGSIELHNQTLIELLPTLSKPNAVFYLDSGGGDGGAPGCVDSDKDGINDDDTNAADNYCETIQLRDVFVAQGYQFNTSLYHWYEKDALHNEAAWAARVFRPLQVLAAP